MLGQPEKDWNAVVEHPAETARDLKFYFLLDDSNVVDKLVYKIRHAVLNPGQQPPNTPADQDENVLDGKVAAVTRHVRSFTSPEGLPKEEAVYTVLISVMHMTDARERESLYFVHTATAPAFPEGTPVRVCPYEPRHIDPATQGRKPVRWMKLQEATASTTAQPEPVEARITMWKRGGARGHIYEVTVIRLKTSPHYYYVDTSRKLHLPHPPILIRVGPHCTRSSKEAVRGRVHFA